MQLSDFYLKLYKFANPWAQGATSSYVTNPIPPTTTAPAASQTLGFPPATASPTGTPPNINDFNGILQYLTAWARWFQAGGPILSDTTFQAAIGGYPAGAVITSRFNWAQQWINSLENNPNDPDTTTGNNGWTPFPVKPQPFFRVINGSFSVYVPNGITQAMITLIGAGGGGGACDGAINSGGGGAGAIVIKYVTGLVGGNTFFGQVGLGGTGGVSNGNKYGQGGGTLNYTSAAIGASVGGATIFGPWIAGGGYGGTGGGSGGGAWSIGGNGGVPGAGTGVGLGDINMNGAAGGDARYNDLFSPAGSGGPGYLGMGGGKGSIGVSVPGTGAFTTPPSAIAGAPGAGGGGMYVNPCNGGSGHDGGVIVEWFP